MPQTTPRQVLTADGLSALSRGVEASTVPEADRSGTQDVPSADKQNDKRSGMDPELAQAAGGYPFGHPDVRAGLCRQGVSSRRGREPLTSPRLPFWTPAAGSLRPHFPHPRGETSPKTRGAPPSGEAPLRPPRGRPKWRLSPPQPKNMLLLPCRGGGLVARERAIRPERAADDGALPDPRLLPMHAIQALGGDSRFRVAPRDRLVVLLPIRGFAGARNGVPVLPSPPLQHFVCHHFQLPPSTRVLCPALNVCTYNHVMSRWASAKAGKAQEISAVATQRRYRCPAGPFRGVGEPWGGGRGRGAGPKVESPKTRQKSYPYLRIVD
jgi:hypothetical protein